MKKAFVLLLGVVMAAALTACSTKEAKPSETSEAYEEKAPAASETAEEKIFAVIEAKDCFDDAGFVEFIAGAEAAEYTFTAEDSDAVEWSVYVLDEAFDDGFRYIKQAAEPVLTGNGTLFIDEGQYVYVYCSANEFTTGTVDENAKLNVTVK